MEDGFDSRDRFPRIGGSTKVHCTFHSFVGSRNPCQEFIPPGTVSAREVLAVTNYHFSRIFMQIRTHKSLILSQIFLAVLLRALSSSWFHAAFDGFDRRKLNMYLSETYYFIFLNRRESGSTSDIFFLNVIFKYLTSNSASHPTPVIFPDVLTKVDGSDVVERGTLAKAFLIDTSSGKYNNSYSRVTVNFLCPPAIGGHVVDPVKSKFTFPVALLAARSKPAARVACEFATRGSKW